MSENESGTTNRNKMKSIIDDIFTVYNSRGYVNRNSGAIGITIVLFIIFFLINSYLFININSAYYKKNWIKYRCDPPVIPFAGLINAPANESVMDYTFKNFSYCLNKILDDIVSFIMAPIVYLIDIITLVYRAIFMMIDEIVRMFDYIRTAVISIVTAILGVIMNFFIPIQKLIMKLKVVFKKVHATTTTSMYTFIGTYMSMMSGVVLAYEFIVMFAFILAAVIIVTWIIWLAFLGLNPVPAAIAVTLTVFLIIILALTIDVAVFSKKLLTPLSPPILPGVPSKPSCFAGRTLIKTKDYGFIPMNNIKPGMVIDNNQSSIVTAVFKMTTKDQEIYKIYDYKINQYIYVTGEHRVFDNVTCKWVKMKMHRDAKYVDKNEFNDEYVYCINTTSKDISIGNHFFKDWDDMYKNEYAILENVLRKKPSYRSCKTGFVNPKTLYNLFENGFHESSMISLMDGVEKPIKDIKIGDILANGTQVRGVANILNTFKTEQYGQSIECTRECHIRNGMDSAIPIHLSLHYKNAKSNKDKTHLWHLLTDNGFISCGSVELLDYNSNLDIYL